MGQDEGTKKKIEKNKWVIPLSVLSLSMILLGGFLPVFFNFSKLTCILKAAIVVFYILGLVLVIALAYFDKYNEEEQGGCWKDKVFSTFLYIVYTLSFLMFFDHELWGYKETVYGLLFLVVLFLEIYISIKIILGKKLNLEKTSTVLISTAVLTFLLAAVNHTANNLIPANLLYKISIGITYLVAIALFIDSYLFKKRDENKTMNTIIGVVFWGSLILVTFPYYVQWCGLKEDDFQTFVTVYAALIGGGITLAGVAWTIKDSNDKRKEDLQRIENDRKEEERQKCIPYIKITESCTHSDELNINIKCRYDFDKPCYRVNFIDKKVYKIQFFSFDLKNISNGHVFITSLSLNGEKHPFDSVLIESGHICNVHISNNGWITLTEPLKTVKIVIRDLIGNEYSVTLKTCLAQTADFGSREEETEDGEKYTIIVRSYFITKASLPKLIEKES